MLSRTTKRLLDVVFASFGIIFTAPLMLVALVAVRLSMGSPVLFVQHRLGSHGREFPLHKIRTMREVGAQDAWNPGLDRHRLTALGRWLRRWSIDELPQLWHVLRGDMSLVGPRPLPREYGPRFSRRQRLRHAVRPGITGWAQIHGRNSTTWAERLERDVWYVEHWSLGLDIRILLITARMVVSGAGVSQDENPMPEFMG